MTWVLDRPASAIGVMAVAAGVISAAAVSEAPARADMVDNSFLAALSEAGVPYNNPAATMALGQSVCAMLVQPGGTFDTAAERMAVDNGMTWESASSFTILAIASYCPGMLSPILPDRFHE